MFSTVGSIFWLDTVLVATAGFYVHHFWTGLAALFCPLFLGTSLRALPTCSTLPTGTGLSHLHCGLPCASRRSRTALPLLSRPLEFFY